MKKKSLISTLKTTKKANVTAPPAKNEGTSTRKAKVKVLQVERMSKPL